jgi:hypothetical protein
MGDKRIVGGRITLTPKGDGTYDLSRSTLTDPLDEATEEERRFFTEQSDYDSLSRLELMRRLRGAEWDAAHYKDEVDRLQRQTREMPPLHKVKELHARMQRVLALLEVPRRRVIPRSELTDAVYAPLSEARNAKGGAA